MSPYFLFTSCMSGVSRRLLVKSSSLRTLTGIGGELGSRAMRASVRVRKGIRVQRSRFVFFAVPPQRETDGVGAAPGIFWMLVSPNNRPLGRASGCHPTYGECWDAVVCLQQGHERLRVVESTAERTGQWCWWAELDRTVVAVSSRSYLRGRECTYNVERFLEAVPKAAIVSGTRNTGRDGRRARDDDPAPRWSGRTPPTGIRRLSHPGSATGTPR